MNCYSEELSKGKNIYFLENKSMKSIIIWFMYYMPLDKNASKNALVSSILLRGCEKYKTSREISRFLNSNYGSIVGSDINLKGEIYTVSLHLNYINPSLECVDGNYEDEILEFLHSIINNPLRGENGFNDTYFEEEKRNLLSAFKGKINDKESYAFDRAIQVMCSNEAYSIDKLGDEESIESLTNEGCYKRYKEIINNMPLNIYVMGNVNREEFLPKLKSRFDFNDVQKISISIDKKIIDEEKEFVENIDTNQGKLVIGFRTDIDINSLEFPALSVVNRLFGGGPEAKLFTALRERESLCYTIYSTVEKHKGMMFVACGIDPSSKDIAVSRIKEILSSIKNGEFTDEELETAKSATKHSLKGIKDNKYTYIGYIQGLNIYSSDYTLDDLCERITTVTRDQVIKAANTLSEDTIYFLGRVNNEN
ncbi:MAG: pitrilysin family protein [Clostridium sp.]|uniref:EF-P 5-aminopentanol modification-associated protein YfmF n=1 Tax=Clostridium sp. TaxID=1506 RepID=UPI002FC6443A